MIKGVSRNDGDAHAKPPAVTAVDRRLEFLEERGYADVAAAAVEKAVSSDQVEQVRERTRQLGTGVSSDRSEAKGRQASARSRRKRSAKAGSEGDSSAPA